MHNIKSVPRLRHCAAPVELGRSYNFGLSATSSTAFPIFLPHPAAVAQIPDYANSHSEPHRDRSLFEKTYTEEHLQGGTRLVSDQMSFPHWDVLVHLEKASLNL